MIGTSPQSFITSCCWPDGSVQQSFIVIRPRYVVRRSRAYAIFSQCKREKKEVHTSEGKTRRSLAVLSFSETIGRAMLTDSIHTEPGSAFGAGEITETYFSCDCPSPSRPFQPNQTQLARLYPSRPSLAALFHRHRQPEAQSHQRAH